MRFVSFKNQIKAVNLFKSFVGLVVRREDQEVRVCICHMACKGGLRRLGYLTSTQWTVYQLWK